MKKREQTFGQVIETACRREGVSLYRLAKLLGVEHSRAPQIVQSRSITERTLRRCAKALKMRVEMKLVRVR